jgi:hypothetical protein
MISLLWENEVGHRHVLHCRHAASCREGGRKLATPLRCRNLPGSSRATVRLRTLPRPPPSQKPRQSSPPDYWESDNDSTEHQEGTTRRPRGRGRPGDPSGLERNGATSSIRSCCSPSMVRRYILPITPACRSVRILTGVSKPSRSSAPARWHTTTRADTKA